MREGEKDETGMVERCSSISDLSKEFSGQQRRWNR